MDVPRPQSAHSVAPLPACADPTAHGEQVTVPVALVNDPGAHAVHVDRYRDASGDRAEFPHAMMMVADTSGADFDAQVAAGCLFPVVAESEVTWSRVTR